MEKTAAMEKALNSTMLESEAPLDIDQEAVWIRRSQAGDLLAFNRLVLKWEQAIYNLCFRMMGNPDEAAEVCQEVFLAAFKNIRKFRRDARFSTWLYRIASNRCLTRLKRQPQGQVSLDSIDRLWLEPQLNQSQAQEKLVLQRERRERVLRALGKLSAEQRAVVEMKIYQEQKFEEIAAILDTPLSTIKSRFYSSLEVLKRQLGHFRPSA